jgi:hypothetical protein
MLVNTIAFYPRLVRVIEPATVLNDNEFGASVVRHTIFLVPALFENTQTFGAQQFVVTRRYLRPVAVVNAQSFGDNQVQLRGRTYLSPNTVGNTSSFGSHRFRKKLLATIFSNVNTFGAHSIASAAKKYSYANTLGTGDRRSTITVTTSGGSSSGTVANLVDGTTSSNPFFSGGVTFKFDLGSAKVIKQVRWKQTNTTAHGIYKWQGSNDDSSYTDIGDAFTLGGATVNIQQTLINNETAFRYYKLTPTTGAMSASPDIQEVEFFIEGSTSDQPDTCYLYPCGGGVNAGGQSPGTGGNGVSRASLVAITASFTPPDGTLSKLVDGQAGNNSSQSTDFTNGLTNATITFDFQPSGKKHVVTGITWEQNTSAGQGNYDWEASNDNTTWTTLKSNFSLVNGSSFNETTWSSTTAYRYHRLKQVSGSTSSSPWIHEIYFKCAPGAYAADTI